MVAVATPAVVARRVRERGVVGRSRTATVPGALVAHAVHRPALEALVRVRAAMLAVAAPEVRGGDVRERGVVGRSRTAAVADGLVADPIHRHVLHADEALVRVRAATLAVAAPEVAVGGVREGVVVGRACGAAVAHALVAHAIHRHAHEALVRVRATVLAVAAPEVAVGGVREGVVVGRACGAAVAYAFVARTIHGEEFDASPGVRAGVQAVAAPRVHVGPVRERAIVGPARRAAVAYALVAYAVHGHVQNALLGVRAAVQAVAAPHMDDLAVREHGVVRSASGATVAHALVADAVYRLLPRRALGGPQGPTEQHGRAHAGCSCHTPAPASSPTASVHGERHDNAKRRSSPIQGQAHAACCRPPPWNSSPRRK